jgi:hypothetical protein
MYDIKLKSNVIYYYEESCGCVCSKMWGHSSRCYSKCTVQSQVSSNGVYYMCTKGHVIRRDVEFDETLSKEHENIDIIGTRVELKHIDTCRKIQILSQLLPLDICKYILTYIKDEFEIQRMSLLC